MKGINLKKIEFLRKLLFYKSKSIFILNIYRVTRHVIVDLVRYITIVKEGRKFEKLKVLEINLEK